ncbi:MAG: DUF1499 domain-containing protein [Caldilineaceae bacterium]
MTLIERWEQLVASLVPAAPGEHGSTFDRQQKRFAPCPASPNCVSTQAPAADQTHAIAPITYTGSLTDTHQHLLSIIQTLPRTTLITVEPNYIHAEFRSRLFRFVDDVEFYFDDTQRLIHFRSASRLGQGDLGVNRKRMEEIRRQFGEGR